jgi:hypothetical protein
MSYCDNAKACSTSAALVIKFGRLDCAIGTASSYRYEVEEEKGKSKKTIRNMPQAKMAAMCKVQMSIKV